MDHSNMRLGRIKPTQPHGLLKLGMYGSTLPAAKISTDWTTGMPDGDGWGMAGNDIAGDCALAGAAHLELCLERWHDGVARAVRTGEVLKNYSCFGYAPPGQDPGTRLEEMLKVWATEGLMWQGAKSKILAAAEVQAQELLPAIDLFGPIICGFDMPLAAQAQAVFTAPQELASAANAPGGWGGHCMLAVGHSPGFVKLVTWGKVMMAEWGWLQAYMDEAWAVLHPVWLSTGRGPNGHLVSELQADMQMLLGTGPISSTLG